MLKQQLPSVDDVIVGNEPNLNRFWLPQFNPDGTNAAAPAYLALLARSYDALKAVDPTTRVWGGALAPRGIDRPGTGRDTHSPVKFLRDMGAAYRASGRTLPVMDGLAFHPYADSSGQSPDTPHPNSTTIGLADYDRLIRTLGTAFDGTAQAGTTLPILYDEFGVESQIPAGQGEGVHRRGAGDDEARRRDHAGPVLRSGRCSSRSASRTSPASSSSTRRTSRRSRAGSRASTTPTGRRSRASTPCAMRSRARAAARSPAATGSGSTSPRRRCGSRRRRELARGSRNVRFTCLLDCAWELRVASATTGDTRARLTGYGRAGAPLLVSLKGRKLGTGPIRFSITLSHPVNPGVPQTRESATLSLR